MASNPLIDNTPKAPTPLAQNGAWLVPVDQRPKGWESMGLREPSLSCGMDPERERLAMVEPWTDKPKRNEVIAPAIIEKRTPYGLKELTVTQSSEKPASRWAKIRPELTKLAEGESFDVDIPEGSTATKFQADVRSILAAWKETLQSKWSITRIGNHQLRVTRRDPWSAGHQVIDVERERIEERVETIATRVTERSVTTQTVVDVPTVVAHAGFSLSKIDRPEAPETQEFLETSLKAWGGDDDDTALFEDVIPRLAGRVNAYREAQPVTDDLISSWAQRNAEAVRSIGAEALRDLWVSVQYQMRDKRLMEVELAKAAKVLRRCGDPCGADTIIELLPEADRTKHLEGALK